MVGTLIASRHPGNPIGWLLCGLALWGAVAELGEAYGYVAAERGLPGGVAGEWLISWSWIVDVTAWVVVVLVFPDGRLPGRRWRLAIWASLAGAGLLFVGQALNANQTAGFSGGRNPLGVASPLVEAAWPVGITLLLGGLVAAVASSVLRYRLYDIDRIISRTLAWALLTLLLGAGYAGVVLGLGRLLPEGSSLAVAVAAAFQPARRRVQQVVAGASTAATTTPARRVAAFSARLGEQVDLDPLSAELLTVADQTMEPTVLSLWLRPPMEGPGHSAP